MNWGLLKKPILPTWTGAGRRFVLPPLALEIQTDFVAGARLEGSGRHERRVRRMGIERLEPTSLVPHPSRPNIANQEELRRAIQRVTEDVGFRAGRFCLIVPDGVVRVGVLTFETLPDDRKETEALVRWRMREKLPFPAEEARVSFQVVSREKNNLEVLAVAARGSVLAEYESAVEAVNGGPAVILPASLALLPLFPDDQPEPVLLLHICSEWVTAVVVAGSRLCFWRTRDLKLAEMENPVGEVASEAARILASTRDHLNVEHAKIWLCVRPPGPAEVISAVAQAISHQVEALAPRAELGSVLPAEERKLFNQFGATIAGLVSNAE
jgi:hypothetical protein